MDNISDKLDLAIRIAGTCCCIAGFAIAYKNFKDAYKIFKDLKSLEDNSLAPDEQEQYDSNQIDNDTDIQNESDQNND